MMNSVTDVINWRFFWYIQMEGNIWVWSLGQMSVLKIETEKLLVSSAQREHAE